MLRKTRRIAVAACLALALTFTAAAPALADDYDERRSGHPLKVLYYVAYPVGLLLDYTIFRPAHWLGSREPFKTIFGHDKV